MQIALVFPTRQTLLLISNEKLNFAINEDFYHLKNCFDSDRLSLNVSKTQIMLSGSRNRIKKDCQSENPKQALKIGEEPLSMAKYAKHLSV